MSQKIERPVLSGQRIKTRKRDEREKYDPTGFRDAVIAGLEKSEGDLDQISKYLDIAGNKLDYRRYGEVLFDILIAGGLLVPGGSISQDGEKPRTNCCIFAASEDMDSMRSHEQVFNKLMRRYKYLEKMFEEEMKKVLVFIKGFAPEERIKLARMTALWIGNGAVPPSVLLVLNNEHLIKDGIALDFLVELFVTFKQEKGLSSLVQALKKGGLESKLMEFFPPNKRTEEYLRSVFLEKGLTEIVKLHKAQASQEAKRELQVALLDDISDNKSHKEIIADIKELALKTNIPEHEIISLIWTTVMGLGEWNKKEELVTDQAVKHLKGYTQLLQAFTTADRSELSLILKVQEYCYENMNFMKAFQKIILLFYRTEVVSEESILRWYKDAHSSKGKMHFLEQMKKFIEWLQNAEEEKRCLKIETSADSSSDNDDVSERDSLHCRFITFYEKYKIIFKRSQVPEIRAQKEKAFLLLHAEYMKTFRKQLTLSQLKRKIQNMKYEVRVRDKTIQRGNHEIIWKEWEKRVFEFMDIETNPGFNNKLPESESEEED